MRVCCLFPSGPAGGKKSCTFITPHEAGKEEEEALAEVSKVQEGVACYLHHVLTTMYIRTCGPPSPGKESNLQL